MRNPPRPKHTVSGRVVYTRKRHFFTERDVLRIITNVSDDDPLAAVWIALQILADAVKLYLRLLNNYWEALNFTRELYRRIWNSFLTDAAEAAQETEVTFISEYYPGIVAQNKPVSV